MTKRISKLKMQVYILPSVNIFSSTSHGVVSDRFWLCSEQLEDRWYTSRFDDSSWSNAYSFRDPASIIPQSIIDLFDARAMLLWHFRSAYDLIYCRGRTYYGIKSTFDSFCVPLQLWILMLFLYRNRNATALRWSRISFTTRMLQVRHIKRNTYQRVIRYLLRLLPCMYMFIHKQRPTSV